MTDNYAKIAQDNLDQLYRNLPENLAENLAAKQEGDRFIFSAFGETCKIAPNKISLGNKNRSSVFDILISLYALNARPDALRYRLNHSRNSTTACRMSVHSQPTPSTHLFPCRKNKSRIR